MRGSTRPQDRCIEPLPVTPGLRRLGQASLILGILGPFTCGASAVVGFVLGVAGLVMCHRRGAPRGEVSRAMEGTFVSAAMIPVGLFAASVLVRAQEKWRDLGCHNNMEQIGLLTLMYCDDQGERLPPAHNWCDSAIVPYGESAIWLRCPSAPKEPCGYAFNAKLSARDRTKLDRPEVVPLEYDAVGGWNAAGGPELFAPRHRGYGNIAYADGHVKRLQPKDLLGLTWNP